MYIYIDICTYVCSFYNNYILAGADDGPRLPGGLRLPLRITTTSTATNNTTND